MKQQADSKDQAELKRIDYSDLVLKQPPLGHGAFGEVHAGSWQGSSVAIKTFFMHGLKHQVLESFQHEANLLASLQHPHIVQFYGIVDQDPYCVVMEYASGGSLNHLLESTKPEDFAWTDRLQIAKDLAKGLIFLHARHPMPVIHGDLKSHNVLLGPNYQAKLADFGVSKVVETYNQDTSSFRGTPRWVAPEMLLRRKRCKCTNGYV